MVQRDGGRNHPSRHRSSPATGVKRSGTGRSSFDAIVVGGGHNGLTTAAYLARAGLDVCVLERREILGGACVTEEVWPGKRVSRASYVVSMLQPKVVADLELARFGYRAIPLDPAYVALTERGPIFFHNDAARDGRLDRAPVPGRRRRLRALRGPDVPRGEVRAAADDEVAAVSGLARPRRHRARCCARPAASAA